MTLSEIINEYLSEKYENESYYALGGGISAFYSMTDQTQTDQRISIFFDQREMRIRPEWDFDAPWSIDYADPDLFYKIYEVMDELGAKKNNACLR